MNRKMNRKNEESMFIKRSFGVKDFRAGGEEGEAPYLEGHAAVFDSMTSIGGWFNEVIERGAFEECNFDDVLFFTNHRDRKVPLARSRRNNANSTMQLSVDNVGLAFRAKLDTENNVEARQVYSSVQRGDISGMSFAFRVKEQKWENLDQEMPTRRITKIAKVYEISAVNEPAYEDTDISARDKKALENAKTALENARGQELDNSGAIEIYRLKNKILGGF